MSSGSGELVFEMGTPNDAGFWSDVFTAAQPTRPVDPLVMRYMWEHPARLWRNARYIVWRGGERIGVASWERPDWDRAEKRFALTGGELLPEFREAGALAGIYKQMEREVLAEGAAIVRGSVNDDDPLRAQVLRSLRYREDRRSRRWELDLIGGRARILAMTEASRAKMRQEGVRLLTLEEDTDPEAVRKIWCLSEEAAHDVPNTLGNVEESLEDYVEWFDSPEIRRDRAWLARLGEEIVGISLLGYPPVRGVVGTEWTATARSVRGRGIARALKCETLAQAIALGVDRVRTGNDAKNDPILHINESMGYQLIAGRMDFLKDAPASS
ncbi:MAG TPA: GNAT family N-acetyltransferase [Methylomirabilota bacterium]|nr:GNAT family N-acetyltransferase [Methylomirabilota bacterium]